MGLQKDESQKKDPQKQYDWLPLPLISEMARRSLKKFINGNRLAIPPIYEKVFFSTAFLMGASELVNQMLQDLQAGQAVVN